MEKQGTKKISFLISSFRAGGGELQMIDIANALVLRGYEVDLLVLAMLGPSQSLVNEHVHIVSLQQRRLFLSFPKFAWYLYKERPSILVSTDQYTQLFSLFAKMITRVPTKIAFRVGIVFSDMMSQFYGKDKLTPFLIRRFYKKADIVIANSKGVADDFCAMTGTERSRVSVIFNPKKINEILSSSNEPVPEIFVMKKKVPVIVATGSLRLRKNFSLLIRAFAKVTKTIPARLVIVGSGRERGSLGELAKSLGIEEVITFVGYSKNPHAYASRADVFVSTALLEGLPNSLLEAMICGTPIISSDCNAGPREILAPDTDYRERLEKGVEYAKYGVLTAVNDEEALVSAILRILSDPNMRARYADLSKKRMVDFEFEKILDKYEKALGLVKK